MRTSIIVSGLTVAFLLTLSARAQMQIDASKITCDQFVHSKFANERSMAAWLSGFYNGKRNNRIIDVEKFEANLTKLKNFCYEEKNFHIPVMQAIEQTIEKRT